jgi:L-fuculose-phosphate aldolase
MGNRRSFIVSEIVKYSQKLDQKGFGANHDGNISVKFDDVLLATPTAVSKGNITVDLIITLDKNGNKIDGIGKPFSEIKLHLIAYRIRPEINAVVHAHPPFATARGLLNLPIKPAIPEAIVSIGDIVPVVAFAMPGAKENDSIIASALAAVDVFIIPGNGVLAVGDCVEQAYLRLELVEHLAKIDYYARSMGTPMTLANADVASLMEKRVAIGLGPKKNAARQQQIPELEKLILEEIKKALQ